MCVHMNACSHIVRALYSVEDRRSLYIGGLVVFFISVCFDTTDNHHHCSLYNSKGLMKCSSDFAFIS